MIPVLPNNLVVPLVAKYIPPDLISRAPNVPAPVHAVYPNCEPDSTVAVPDTVKVFVAEL